LFCNPTYFLRPDTLDRRRKRGGEGREAAAAGCLLVRPTRSKASDWRKREREREREREEEVGRRIHDKVGGKVVLLFGISDM
jgi:hypothetical protein